ncbi:MAG: HigA family addiction module antitoxin [Candidatus Omnitrophica bacterium]|nr:HigA family addiction module antitoxin [Candidatus Omnitrophota bacterium]
MDLVPARATKPGTVISMELEARGWSQKDLAEIMDRPLQAINEIINGNKQITPETAYELSEAFGTSAELWMNLETSYRLFLARETIKSKEISRRSRLFGLAPIKELIKRGWVEYSESLDVLERNVCDFLEISRVDLIPAEANVSRRHSLVKEPEYISQISIIKRAKALAKKRKVSKFKYEIFEKEFLEILEYSKDIGDIKNIQEKLAKLGVCLMIVPALPQSFLDGAVFYLNGKPVIVVTLRYDRVDNFWFTLMHEVAHIILKDKGTHLDDRIMDLSVLDVEKRADKKAQNWLIPQLQYDAFLKTFSGLAPKRQINNFAKEIGRHPGIVLGRLHHDKVLDYSCFRSMLQKVGPAL